MNENENSNVESMNNKDENKYDETVVNETVTDTEEETSTQKEPVKEETTLEEDVKQEETTSTEEALTDNGKQPKVPFIKKHKSGVMMSGCFLLALAGGFGGTLAANHINGNGGVIMYQSANTTKTTTTAANGDTMSIKQITEAAANSVVEIKTESVSTNSFFPQAVSSGAGSGVILTKDGYIVTNNHVIDGADKVTVTTKDGKSYNAKLIGTDASTDLAVIKIEASNLSPAVMGKSSKLEVGDTAVAIGNPLGELGGTVTSGIISALDREITVDNQKMHLLQTNAAINPGNSGGGLFNDRGELIGIVNAKSSGNNIEGLGFAIPIDRAKDVIENLIENGYVKGRASLGVTLSTATNPYGESMSAVYIAKVESGKAADKAGLEVGDQILKVDGKKVSDIADVKTAVNSHKAGETMTMNILRNNETKTIKVTLGEADASTTTSNNEKSQQSDQQNGMDPFSNFN